MNIGGENNNGGLFTSEKDTHLTACKTSLFSVGDVFNVYDCNGQLIFRVDSYDPDWGDQVELVLMDASGRCLLTVRRKWRSLHNRREGYRGERSDQLKPTFSVKRSSIIGRSEVTVEMYENEGEKYQIDGSFEDRNCTTYDAKTREVMVEIRRKVDITSNVVLGCSRPELIPKHFGGTWTLREASELISLLEKLADFIGRRMREKGTRNNKNAGLSIHSAE